MTQPRPATAHTQDGSAGAEPFVPPPPIGREVALAQVALRQFGDGIIQREGTTFDTWLTLDTLAREGSSASEDAFRREMAGRLQIDLDAMSAVLGRLQSTGAVRLAGPGGEVRIELTDAGAAEQRRLATALQRGVVELIGPLERGDVETAVRVLRAVAERARALSAGGSAS